MKTQRVLGIVALLVCLVVCVGGAELNQSPLVTGNLARVAEDLGVTSANGYYELSTLLEAIVARLAPQVIELVPGETVRAGQLSRLTFRTPLVVNFVEYRIAVVYLGTRATAKAKELAGAPTGTDEDTFWWDWPCDTSSASQDAVAVVTARWGESGATLCQAFLFHIE
jgi:hypothetical protein